MNSKRRSAQRCFTHHFAPKGNFCYDCLKILCKLCVNSHKQKAHQVFELKKLQEFVENQLYSLIFDLEDILNDPLIYENYISKLPIVGSPQKKKSKQKEEVKKESKQERLAMLKKLQGEAENFHNGISNEDFQKLGEDEILKRMEEFDQLLFKFNHEAYLEIESQKSAEKHQNSFDYKYSSSLDPQSQVSEDELSKSQFIDQNYIKVELYERENAEVKKQSSYSFYIAQNMSIQSLLDQILALSDSMPNFFDKIAHDKEYKWRLCYGAEINSGLQVAQIMNQKDEQILKLAYLPKLIKHQQPKSTIRTVLSWIPLINKMV